MGRELKRVPLDFDHPLGEVWPGYLSPGLPQCGDCGGEGYGPEARAVAHTFYAHQIGGHNAEALAWSDKLGQAEVDHLVEKGRLQVWRDGEWHKDPRTADEVNAEQRAGGLRGHDAINRMYLVAFRCERLGIPTACPTCEGHGTIATAEEREANEAWEGTEPPEGEGYQLWETTSEGSPKTPVFETLDELCAYAAEHVSVFASDMASAAEWRRMLDDGFVALTMQDPEGNRVVLM